MKNGTQTKLAKAAQISTARLSSYLRGKSNALAPIADRLSMLTDTDIRVWLKGGDPRQRREAFAKWAEASRENPIMKNGTKTKLAITAQITPGLLSYYLNGKRNASAPLAERLSTLTGSDIKVWLIGGDPAQRKEAFDRWAEMDQANLSLPTPGQAP
jgi:plasmid maintenance system antidote protein VapI